MMRRAGFLLLAVIGLMVSTGCASQRLQDERDALWMQNEELQQELADERAANDALQREIEQLESQLAQRPEPQQTASANTPFSGIQGVETDQTSDRVTVRVPGDVLFAPGQAELRDSAKQTLREIASVLRSEYGGETVRVEGYTDTDPIRQSDWADNLELSLHRAAAVERYLIEQGVSPDLAYSAGFGQAKARSTKEQSRRVEIVVVLNE